MSRNAGTYQPLLLDTVPAHVVLQAFNLTILTLYVKCRNYEDPDCICLLYHSLPAFLLSKYLQLHILPEHSQCMLSADIKEPGIKPIQKKSYVYFSPYILAQEKEGQKI